MPVFEADNDDFTLTLCNLNYGSNYATQVKELLQLSRKQEVKVYYLEYVQVEMQIVLEII